MGRRLVVTPHSPGGFGIELIKEGPVLKEVVLDGDFEYEEVDTNVYVQVEFPGTFHKLYTYVDPWGDLAPGDLVDVPTQFAPQNFAIVKKLGNGLPRSARRHSTVAGRYPKPEPAPEIIARQSPAGGQIIFGHTPCF